MVSVLLEQSYIICNHKDNGLCDCDTGTLVQQQDNTMIVNAEVDTLIESNLGTMIINDTDEEDSAAADSSETMKRWFLNSLFGFLIALFVYIWFPPPLT